MAVKNSVLFVPAACSVVMLAITGFLFLPTNEGPSPSNRPIDHHAKPSLVVTTANERQASIDFDDWQSEREATDVTRQLDLIREAIESNQTEALNNFLTADFAGMFPNLNMAARRTYPGGVSVARADRESGVSETVSSLGAFFDKLLPAIKSPNDLHAKFKIIRVGAEDNVIDTVIRFEFSTATGEQAIQQTSHFQCLWKREKPNGKPKLAKISTIDFEQTTAEQGKLFEDCTQAILAGNRSYRDQMLPGIPFWLKRIPKEFMGQFGHHGMAVADVNGDGLDDVYVCDAGGLPNRLYIQQDNGTAIDGSATAGVDILDDSVGCLLIDLDNDGDQDLVVGTDPFLRIMSNDGTGKFTLAASIAVDTDSFSLSSADYDSDGDLDIYVCGYDVRKDSPTDRGLPFPIPYHDANNGGKNVLLQNNGDFTFSNVTDLVGLNENNSRFSMAAAWDDFDNDGDIDLYVANDFGRNNLYRNDNGRFVDVAATAGVEDHASGMSVACGDYNRDGNVDIYVGNMFSSAGNRVTYQRRFSEGVGESTVAKLQRMARGNTLFSNRGDETFHDETILQNVAMGRWAWGSVFADITNSGWQDLIVANGYLTNEDSSDL